MKTHVIVFPGSNCDRDVAVAIQNIIGSSPEMVWHKDSTIKQSDLIVVPGGFSYGDYLRCGAMASTSPIMKSVIENANKGVPVIGICNGFQILTEAGFLPGALTNNKNLNFICKDVELKVHSQKGGWFKSFIDKNITLPIAHGEGRYYCDDYTYKELLDNDLIALKYIDNPNGSTHEIAGILNKEGNVLGLMPHPERACDKNIGGIDGEYILKNLIKY